MMFMARVGQDIEASALVTTRLLRRWAAARNAGGARLPAMSEKAAELGVSPTLALAPASLFELTEACLGRPLVPECCCSVETSPDERAVLLMLAAAPATCQPFASHAIPHGLPGALAWAIGSVRHLMREEMIAWPAESARCPFARAPA